MDLKIWLVIKNKTLTEFSKEIDFSRQHLDGVINGRLKAGNKLARVIAKYTNDEVKKEDLDKKYHDTCFYSGNQRMIRIIKENYDNK